MDGRPGTAPDRSNLVLLAAQLIVEEALEAEVRDEVGRERYERAEGDASGYRNGYRTGRMKTAEGVEFAAPQVRDTAEPFVSGIRQNLAGRTGAPSTDGHSLPRTPMVTSHVPARHLGVLYGFGHSSFIEQLEVACPRRSAGWPPSEMIGRMMPMCALGRCSSDRVAGEMNTGQPTRGRARGRRAGSRK